ncbi:MAG: HEAT repeat domain-containing protein [Litorilinea sp.]
MPKKSKNESNRFGQNGAEPSDNDWNLSEFELEDFLNLELPDDEEIDWSVYALQTRPAVDMDAFLSRVADSSSQIPNEDLTSLSDLSRADAALVREQWPLIGEPQRLALVTRLLEIDLDDLEIELSRFWRIVLHDEAAVVRAAAIHGLTGEVYEDLLGPFVQFLRNDPVEEVRAAAAAALGAYVLAGELDELDSSLAMRAEESLLDVLHDENEPLDVQCRALESIAFSGEVGIRQLIDDAYYAEDEELRVSSLIAMGRSADVRWRGKVVAELHNASPLMRAEAAYACGELEAHDGQRDLIELLDDEHEIVRLAAIFALGRLGGPEARSALDAFANAPESLESEAAQLALEEMQFFSQSDVVPLLNELLGEDDWDDADEDGGEDWDDTLDEHMVDFALTEFEDTPASGTDFDVRDFDVRDDENDDDADDDVDDGELDPGPRQT